MCGIAGKIYFNNQEVEGSELLLMSKKIEHRGPDDEGIYISKDRKAGLVNRRLAIIDLSSKGHQPMQFKGRYWITFNGEIYNYQIEKEKLEKGGYKFNSKSDTEIILALYDKYGERCLKHLRGMFAFAIYDERENTLFLARDRIGKKPLKYFLDGSVFIFASELKAILTQKEIYKSLDWFAIHNYLTYGFVPSPNTGFSGIKKLEPGHYLTLDIKSKKIKNNRYWFPDFSEKLQLSEKEWCDKILEVLEESTRLRMIADVPIGAFLSGGVDSSGVVATMSALSVKPIKTFTIVFEEEKYNEKKYANRIAKMYKTDHHELLAQPESIDELLPNLTYQYEEPYADSSAVITYMVSKLAREYVTVILNGDGGDENFTGYDRFDRLNRDVFLDKFQRILRPAGIPLTSILSQTGVPLFKRAYKFLQKSRLPLSDRFVTYNCYFTNDDKKLIYSDYFNDLTKNVNSYEIVSNKFEKSKTSDPRDDALYSDMTSYLPDDLLTKVDIASMSVSLEARSPFLDHNIIELACKIPFNLKLKNGEHKYILKKALEKIVPKENLYRQKLGFSIPLDKWFTGKLNKYAESVLLNKNALTRKLFNQNEIRRMLKSHTEKTDFGSKLWLLLTLELWFKNFFD